MLEKVARAVVKAVAPHPVTAKIRIGWDQKNINACTTARLLEDCGIQALAVHGRTKEQGYSGLADWEVIGEVARAVQIPVIGNGDVQSPLDVAQKRSFGVAGVMLGRAIGTVMGQRAEVLGGVVLIIVGSGILYEHLSAVA